MITSFLLEGARDGRTATELMEAGRNMRHYLDALLRGTASGARRGVGQ